MIKRNYFISYRKNHADGNGSFSGGYRHISRWSWLDQSAQALRDAVSEIESDLSDKPGDAIEVVCFSRC